ncbi:MULTISPECIES: lytic transglycosylase domain-containing protein [Fusobacterium]|jgi:lytic murein transglycosylase|uniref:Lytic transglycosylase domain-containing protein n=2 Tax=Fusobacterium vincentii TaxID=155615 RepID=A0ABV3YBC5_FUSVC|nr:MULTISPECIES: lytic transglycosylase domain-containing protein [Fusobacterium]EEO39337.1 hypothetical protein FSCG_00050 [Fusobacterium vincentii 4_1_13]EEW94087.1 hypothetical protein HMPREF0406_01983 [Fusobacterium animalis 3_1_33]EFG34987.1 hypothetical protein HMPREF0405_01268 [Fusobacterium vincentii 3_1_27]ERT39996.1 hypothetical protein HMPREF1539_02164 [Fusobacterium nucleatum CTI-2]ERT41493.1 hypothetical protein HMPREF1538_01108 [Fusobacterium nucleatum CTI-1]
MKKNILLLLLLLFSSKPIFSKENFVNKVKEYVISNVDNYELATELYGYIKYYAKEYGVEEELVVSVIKVESNYDVVAVSPVGAIGLMQLMPKTAEYLGVEAEYIPENIKGGVKYLKECLSKNGEDIALALAAYNAGLGAVKKYSSIPPYRETQKYIEKVLKEYNKLKKEKYVHNIVEFKEDSKIAFEDEF